MSTLEVKLTNIWANAFMSAVLIIHNKAVEHIDKDISQNIWLLDLVSTLKPSKGKCNLMPLLVHCFTASKND